MILITLYSMILITKVQISEIEI